MKERWGVVTAVVAAVLLISATAASGAPGDKPTGKDLYTTYKCQSCHPIAAEKIEKTKPASSTDAAAAKPASTEATAAKPASTEAASTSKKASDLSGIGAKRDAAWISRYLLKEEKIDEKLHKTAKFKGTPEELKTLTMWLESLKTPVKTPEVSSK